MIKMSEVLKAIDYLSLISKNVKSELNAKGLAYSDDDVEKMIRKLSIRVLDYCKKNKFNIVLANFIAEKIVVKYEYLDAVKKLKDKDNATVGGVELSKVQSVSRGDTTITLRDKKVTTNDEVDNDGMTLKDPFKFDEDDYLFLSRQRKLIREHYDEKYWEGAEVLWI